MERIVAAKALPGYRLWLRFTDDAEGEVDVSHMLGKGIFSAWKDPRVFEAVFVDPECGTVCWPGNLDLDPDVLYSRVTGKPLPGEKPRAGANNSRRARTNGRAPKRRAKARSQR